MYARAREERAHMIAGAWLATKVESAAAEQTDAPSRMATQVLDGERGTSVAPDKARLKPERRIADEVDS